MRFGECGLWGVEAAFGKDPNLAPLFVRCLESLPEERTKFIHLSDVTVVVLDLPAYSPHEWKFSDVLREVCERQRAALMRNPK